MSLAAGDSLPHFEVATIDGRTVAYRSIWQRKKLVLVILAAGEAGSESYARALQSRVHAMDAGDSEWVITYQSVASVVPPAIVIADQWGDVAAVVTPKPGAELPDVDQALEWVEHLRHRCPECEGEAR